MRFPVGVRILAAAAVGIVFPACDAPVVTSNPTPVVLGTDPEILPRAASPIEVEVRGLGFVEGAEVRWNGTGRATTLLSSTRLLAEILPEEMSGDEGEVTVANPAPGGGVSAALAVPFETDIPVIESVSPSQAEAVGTTPITLDITGTGFMVDPPGTRVLWEGAALPTVVHGPTHVSATLPDFVILTARTISISVVNPGGVESAAVTFDLINPVPEITEVEPPGVTVGENDEVTVWGVGFVFGSMARLNGELVAPTSVSANRLVVEVPGHVSDGELTVELVVENPAPGGGVSNSVDLVVFQKPPIVTHLVPNAVLQGHDDFTLVIQGADFSPSATVTWNGAPRTATVVNSGRIEMEVPAADVAVAGLVEITIANPGAEGETSVQFLVVGEGEIGHLIATERWGGSPIVVSELDGSNATSFPVKGFRVDASPVWLKVVYGSEQNRITELDMESGETRSVTGATGASLFSVEEWPRYSYDGAWIYFGGQRSTHGRYEIWRAAENGTVEAVVQDPSSSVAYPSPSHSGRYVVFRRSAGGDLWLYDQLTETSSPLGVSGATSRWSLGDEWIVYHTGSSSLRAVHPDGTGDFALTSGVSVGPGFDFSPTGMSLIGTTQSGQAIEILFPSGTVEFRPALGQIGSAAWFGP